MTILRRIRYFIQIAFLLFMVMFIVAGSTPQFYKFLQQNNIVMVEESSHDSHENIKEKEVDKYFYYFNMSSFIEGGELEYYNFNFKYKTNLFAENVTPPPEQA